MRRAFTTLTALTALTVLGACSTDDESTTESTAEENGSDDAMETEDDMGDGAMESEDDGAMQSEGAMGGESMGDPFCDEFFAGQGTPLAERADTQRENVGGGDDLDPVSFSELTLLSSRIATLAETADSDQMALLERINAPFQEVNDAVIEDGSRMDEEISIPSVDVEDSSAAQDEFLAACEA